MTLDDLINNQGEVTILIDIDSQTFDMYISSCIPVTPSSLSDLTFNHLLTCDSLPMQFNTSCNHFVLSVNIGHSDSISSSSYTVLPQLSTCLHMLSSTLHSSRSLIYASKQVLIFAAKKKHKPIMLKI